MVILDFDNEKRRISLGLKQLKAHPWDKLDTELKIGDKVKGRVRAIEDYGAFVEVMPGVEGLIHVSEISWSQHLRSAGDFLKAGDEIEAVIVMLDKETRKMSLSIKQMTVDPWSTILDKYPKGSKHTAAAKNITGFGIFVELEPGIDGLIHISDLSWSKKIKHPSEFAKLGDKIDCVVMEVDAENKRISLGVKQLEENPWDAFESVFALDSVHKGTITSITDKGAIIGLPYGIEGFAPKKHLVKADDSNAAADEQLDFKVLEFNKETRKIIVSHTRMHQEATEEQKRTERKEEKESMKKVQDGQSKNTLGDLEGLAKLKREMEGGN